MCGFDCYVASLSCLVAGLIKVPLFSPNYDGGRKKKLRFRSMLKISNARTWLQFDYQVWSVNLHIYRLE